MNVVRGARKQRFVVVDRATINDARLSFRARGLLAWLLDKPDGWSANTEAIARAAREGRDAVRTALKELETCGYLSRQKTHGKDGRWEVQMVVFETTQGTTEAPVSEPDHDGKPAVDHDGFPVPDHDGKPGTGFPATDFQAVKEEDSLEKTPVVVAQPRPDDDGRLKAALGLVVDRRIAALDVPPSKPARYRSRALDAVRCQLGGLLTAHLAAHPDATVEELAGLDPEAQSSPDAGVPASPCPPRPCSDPACARCDGEGVIFDAAGAVVDRCWAEPSQLAPPSIGEWAPEPIGVTS